MVAIRENQDVSVKASPDYHINARLNAIWDELEDYHHYEDYKKRFKLLFEFYQLEELSKYFNS